MTEGLALPGTPPPRPPAADWASTRRRRPGATRIAVAVLLHAAALLALEGAFDRVELRVRGERATTLVSVALVPLAPKPQLTEPPRTLPSHGGTRVAPRPAPPTRRAEPAVAADNAAHAITTPAASTPQAAVAAASAASTPRLDLSPALVQMAVRDVARHPSVAGAANLADPATTSGERLSQSVASAQKGDCAKGEFFGGGAGLLSLPFLAAAEALGKCSSK